MTAYQASLHWSVPAGERAARIAWARLVEPEDEAACALVARVGAEEALQTVDPASALGRRIAPRLPLLDVERDLEIVARLGARIVVPGDDEWPTGLDVLGKGPFCLWVAGSADLDEACRRSVAVVGSRTATHYGLHQARELASGLAQRDVTVVSGAAYGIDGAAHEGALSVDGVTVAVIAGGIDRPYPAGHAALLRRIRETGAVVGEVPPGSAPTKWRFLARNRLIATLTRGTVVVEANLRSGSLHTARRARDHHRVVCAVPGPVTSTMSAGCHQLLRGGEAILVTDTAEVLEATGSMGELAPPKQGPVEPTDDLDAVQQTVYAALPVRRGASVDALARHCGLSEAVVLSALGILGLRELSTRDGQGYLKRRRRPAGATSGDEG
jgi:DNA processing protein